MNCRLINPCVNQPIKVMLKSEFRGDNHRKRYGKLNRKEFE